MPKRVLLTGATGFVGRQVLRALAMQGARVRAVVRTGGEKTLEKNPAVEGVLSSADIFAETPAWWARACDGIDIILHVAWYAEPGQYLFSPRNMACLSGTLALAQGGLMAGVGRFAGIGTCFEYDLSGGEKLDISSKLDPQTPYGRAKAETFLTLSRILPPQGMSFVWCRLFYLYGEGEDERRLVPYLRSRLEKGEEAALTSGRQVRDFMDVSDAASRIVRAALAATNGAVNICSGDAITVRTLAERIADEYGRRDLLRFGARADNVVDPPCVVGVPTPLSD